MKRSATIIGITVLTLVALSAVTARSYKESSERTIRETYPFGSKRALVVDNLHGSVRITGTSGSEVRLVAIERIRARTTDRIEEARREVALVVHEYDEALVICADGPFRESGDCTEWRNNNRWDPQYEVWYEIELEVPRNLELNVRTIEGDIEIRDIHGDFDVRGVNGDVRMTGIAGSGRANTVNGPVTVIFDRNPTEDSNFQTVNGEIDISFPSGLDADMTFETMNGEIYSDFEYEMLPPRTVRHESRNSTRFRLESRSLVRIGSGGPEFHFENINGDILLRRG